MEEDKIVSPRYRSRGLLAGLLAFGLVCADAAAITLVTDNNPQGMVAHFVNEVTIIQGTQQVTEDWRDVSGGQEAWEDVQLDGPVAGSSAASFANTLSPNVTGISFGPVTIPKIPIKREVDARQEAYKPGEPVIGPVVFTLRHDDEVQQWVSIVFKGTVVRRDIEVSLMNGTHKLRTYEIINAIPISYKQIGTGREAVDVVTVQPESLILSDNDHASTLAWFNDTMDGDNILRDVKIESVVRQPVKYANAFLTGALLPQLSISGVGAVTESMTFTSGVVKNLP